MNCPYKPTLGCSLGKTSRGYECTGYWNGSMCNYVNFNGKYNYGIRDGDIKTFMWVNKIEMAFREEFPDNEL